MPSDNPASNSPRGSPLAELRAELVKVRDDAQCLRAGVREPTYDGPRLTDVWVRDGQELVRDEASGEWRPLTEADREQERLARIADAKFFEQYKDASTQGLRFAVSELITRSLRPCLAHFAKLATRVVTALDALRPGCFFGVGLPSMDVGEIMPGALHHYAFGTDDVVEAGRRMLAWSAWADEENELQPFDYSIRYNAWSMSLIAIDENELRAFVRCEPFKWALAAFDRILADADGKSPGASETKPMATGGPVDLKGERFRRLHIRFLDGSQRFPYLRYIAATGHNNCPGWPRVPTWPSHDTLGLAHKDWLDVANKRPGTFFVAMNEHWLEIEGQLWPGSFYFDGSVPNESDHDALHRQSVENKEAMDQFELLANEAAGFLGNLPSVHRGVDFPREPKLWHRWLEAVCASAQVEPAGYHCFDVRRVPGNIFQASAILLECLHTAADKPDAITRPLAPLNIDGFDLRPALAAAEALLAERRKADERGKFDEGGAAHILGIARLRLAEALAPFNHPDGLIGDDATIGAIAALWSMANDGCADSHVERIEAVIAFLRKATWERQAAAIAALGHLPDSLAQLAGAITTDAADRRAEQDLQAQRRQANKAMDEAAEQAYHYRNIDARDFPSWERCIIAFVESCKAAGHDAELAESIAHFAALPNKAACYAADVVRQAAEHPGSGTAAAALDAAVRGGFIRDVREAIEGICDRATQPRRAVAKLNNAGQSEANTQPPRQQKTEPPFVPLPAHKAILEALDGRALRTDDLASAANLERRSLFDRKRTDGTVIRGYLKELINCNLVVNHRRLGYYRLDRPPPQLRQAGDNAGH